MAAAPVQVVWFKRDLRLRDHRPLSEACARGPVLALYCFEPALLAEADADRRHRAFIEASLAELAHDLRRIGLSLVVREADILPSLDAIRRQMPVSGLWCHQETGNLASFKRDQAVAAWCREHQVSWFEYRQFGVFRGRLDRDHWDTRWEAFMREPLAHPPPSACDAGAALAQPWQPDAALARDHAAHQRGGRRAGVAVLSDFLDGRAAHYRGGISSPLKAPTACSRLSPYLAWGNVSMRELVQATRRRREALRAAGPMDPASERLASSLAAFESRLHWHCHFIQKLESQPELELHNMHRGYDGLREDDFERGRFDAWCRGETGYPLIDACMRMLGETGWLNFRMRAMLMSFAAYHLWLHWREPGLHLARLFTDYEPGIHWPQVQMQSGVTGINALRIYNPVLQAQRHDPQGRFVRRWLPALANVPTTWIFQPWLMPASVQREAGCVIGRDYPPPVIDVAHSLQQARARYSAWRQRPGLGELSREVFLRHGSRKRQGERRVRSAASGPMVQQLGLFDEGKHP